MLCLIKNENIFSKFCENIYTIRYQKGGLPHIYFFIFLYSADQFFEVFQIDKIIYIKLFILKTDLTGELTKIVISIMFYGFYKNINPYLSYISNIEDNSSKYTKRYFCNFFEETFI